MDDSTRLQVESLHETARRQQARWQWAAARDTLRRAAHVTQEADRSDGVSLLSTERMLAEVLRELGDLREAERLASSLVPRCESLLGPGHPGTVRARAVLATIAYDLGDRDAAYGLCRQVLDSGKGTDGPAARAVLLTQANLARLYRDRGEPELALSTLRAAHGTFRRRYGDEDLDTLRMAADLAELHLASGDRPAARQLLTRSHHRARALLGAGHPFTVRLEERLAAVEPPMPAPPEPEDAPRRRRRRRTESPAPPACPPAGPPVGLPAEPPSEPHPPASQRRTRYRTALLQRLADRRMASAGTLRRHKNSLLAAALAVVATAVVSAVVVEAPAAVRGLRRAGRSLQLHAPAPTPTQTAPGVPIGLTLADHGGSITVGWDDPSHGTATVVVSLSRNGAASGSVVTLARGTTSYTATALDPSSEYCFLVALLPPDATSARPASICTTARPTARPAAAPPAPDTRTSRR